MTTTFDTLTSEVLQILQGYGLDQPRVAYTNGVLTDSDIQIQVDDASSISQGIAEIGDEMIFVRSVDRSNNTLTVTRGQYGSTAAAHAAVTAVYSNPTWPRNRVKNAINNAIVGTHPTLFGVAQTQFTFNPAVSTYSLPATAERVLAVTADVNGPSLEQQNVRRYFFNSVAPTDDWATTNTITLHESVSPGRTVTVTYAKAPTALSAGSDLLTASGLRESAKQTVIYGALSELTSFMDVARLPVDTAQSDEFDERNAVGMASRVSGQLYLRYQAELEAERRRLRETTPVVISVRKR